MKPSRRIAPHGSFRVLRRGETLRLRLLKLGNVDRVRKKLLFMPSKTDWKMKLLKVLLHPRLQEFLASRAADPDMKSSIVPHCLERESARIRQDR